jgi:hypothetical protein
MAVSATLPSRLSMAQVALAPPSATALNALTNAAKRDSAKPSEEAVTIRKSQTALRKEMRDATRTQARQTVERLRKELKLIKSILANDPKQMARAISRIAKELKQALSDYAQVAKENGESFSAASMGFDAAPPAAPADVAEENAEASSDDEASPTSAGAEANQPQTDKAIAAYGRPADDERAQAKDAAEMEARGDLDFAREVRDLVRKLREALQESKIRHAFNTVDRKGQQQAEDEAAKGLAEVDELNGDMETDIKAAFPGLTVHLQPLATG